MNLGLGDQVEVQRRRYRHRYHHHRAHHYRRALQNVGSAPGTNTGAGEIDTNVMSMLSTLKEDDDKFTLMVDIPGLAKNQCSLKLENHLLTVTATPEPEKSEPGPSEEGQIIWSERPITATKRTMPIPNDVDSANISAKEEHGVLYVYMPKTSEAKGDETETYRIKVA